MTVGVGVETDADTDPDPETERGCNGHDNSFTFFLPVDDNLPAAAVYLDSRRRVVRRAEQAAAKNEEAETMNASARIRRAVRTLAVSAVVLATGLAGLAQAKTVVCRVELDRPVLPADTEQTAVVKVALDAPEAPADTERPPVNLAVVLDRSGSMSGHKIEKAKQAAIEALRRLSARDVFSLVIYNHQVQTVVPAQSAGNVESIEARIRGIGASGNTALFGGVSQGAAEVRKNVDNRRYVHRILLLSDGLANVGPDSPADLGRLGAALIKEGISVTTVGVGTDYNEDLMTRLSQASDGNTYFAETGDDLPRIFSEELGDVLTIVAKKVILEIHCPAGLRPVRIIGREGSIRDNRVEIHLNQLYGGQQKFALIEVTVPPSTRDTSREVAVATCSYDNVFSQRRETASGRATARFTEDEKEVIASANKQVQVDYANNLTAIAKDKAIELADQGKKEEAVRVFDINASVLQGIGTTFNNDAVNDISISNVGYSQRLQKEGMTKGRRKGYRSDSYQTRNQQRAK